MLPADWRERFVAMVRGAAPLSGEWFTGGPVCTPIQQAGIYAEQYRLRLYDALLLEIRGLAELARDDPRLEASLRRYLADHPSRSWTLNRVADPLAPWLAREPHVPPEWVEMAWLDRAVQAGFEAADGPPVTPEQLATMPSLVLQPHVSVLRLRFDVHHFRALALGTGERREVSAGDFPVVVFRRDTVMRHWQVPLGLWGILDAIGRGLPVSAALDEVHRRGLADVPTLAEHVGGWFRDLAERNLVSVA